MTFQFAMASVSNLLFNSNMWTRTGHEQHMNKSIFFSNKDLIIKNDDIQNVSGKHEDGKQI